MHFVEIMGFVAVLVFSSYLGSTKKDFLYVILFFICVILGFLRKEKNILLHNPVIGYLGKLSYTIYLSHGFIRDLLAEKIGGGYV
jgi:peptidoglycan/LPS O-acetylase OafA/YrhL